MYICIYRYANVYFINLVECFPNSSSKMMKNKQNLNDKLKKKSAIEVIKEEYLVSITSQTYCNHGRPLATPSSPLPPPEIRAYKGVISHQCPLTRP